jgi:uncharacterized protein YacL
MWHPSCAYFLHLSFMKMSLSCMCLLKSIVSLLSILKVIFLESNPLRFIETLISFSLELMLICARLFVFVFRKQTTLAPLWKGDAMRYCATGNVDQTFVEESYCDSKSIF